MSRSNAPLQATINKWVNYEAVMAYIGNLRRMAEADRQLNWLGDSPESERRADHLDSMADRMEEALNAANLAHMAHERAAYDRIYGRVRP